MVKFALNKQAWKAKVPTWAKLVQVICLAYGAAGSAYFNAEQVGHVVFFGTEWTVAEQFMVHHIISYGFALILQFLYYETKNSATPADTSSDKQL